MGRIFIFLLKIPQRNMLLSVVFFFFVLVTTATWRTSTALPPGFVTEGVARYKRITDISTIPLPEYPKGSAILLVTLKEGQIYVHEDPDNNPDHAILAANMTDRLCRNGERGLQSAIVHPDYRRNRYIYLYYTYKGTTNCEEDRLLGPVNRCSRFILRADYTIDMSTERVLFQTSPLEKRYHNGGDMEFGPDGYLYIGVGDGGLTRASRISQSSEDLLGTLVRITAGGNIPPENPYRGGVRCNATGASPIPGRPCREIFALGLRNPYKMAVDPNESNTTRILINDVGGQTWEETSWGGTDYAGVNYGWPDREGPCDGNGNAGNNVENCVADKRFQDPEHYYLHRDMTDEGGGAIVGGALIPNGYWPAKYNNGYFFADFVFGEIYHINRSPNIGCRDCKLPLSPFVNETFHSFATTSAIVFAPYKDTIALYYGAQKLTRWTLHRIIFVGGENVSPTARAESNATTAAAVGQAIRFTGRHSTDPDVNDVLSYRWDLGDGRVIENRTSITHVYRSNGVYRAVLTVEDGKGGKSQDSLLISIGSPPTARIDRPREGTKFAVGEVFTLEGLAFDQNGDQLPASSLSWEVRQHHSTHWHPFVESTTGNKIRLFPAPAPEDFLAATNSHLEVLLTATDSNGLSATVSRLVMPKTVWLTFDSKPSGIDLYLDDYRIETPQKVLSWESHLLNVVAPGEVGNLVFSGWSDGGGKDHVINVPRASDTPPQYIAEFRSIDPPTDAPSIKPVGSPVSSPTQTPQTRPVSPTGANVPTKQPQIAPMPEKQPQIKPILEIRSIGDFSGSSRLRMGPLVCLAMIQCFVLL